MSKKPEMIDGEILPFEIKRETWNEYELPNGDLVRLKTSVQRIVDSGLKNPDGTPKILVNHNTKVAYIPKNRKVRIPKPKSGEDKQSGRNDHPSFIKP